MWPLAVVIALGCAAGYAAMAMLQREPVLQEAQQADLAANFALYRSLVVAYARAHPGTVGSVPDEALALPVWYVRYPAWANSISDKGMVAVYAKQPVGEPLLSELASLSGGSMMAGEARNDGQRTYLYSPLQGDTGIELRDIPAGAPVWVAYIQ